MLNLDGRRPLFSVVIPTFNRANDLKRALLSVQSQTCSDWEAIIVDNHSEDETSEVVDSFFDRRISLYKVRNRGIIAISRNLGVEKSLGKYIAFLDSDDWWAPQKLELSLNALNSGAEIVYHDLFLVKALNSRKYYRKVKSWDLQQPVFDSLLAKGNALPNSSVVIKRSLLKAINGLSEDPLLAGIEDYHCWLRIAKITNRFKRLPQSLGFYWAGGGNFTNPSRTLDNINALEMTFKEEIADLIKIQNIWWIEYAKGLRYFLLHKYCAAKQHLESIPIKETPISIYLKSRLLLIGICALKLKNFMRDIK